MVNAKMGLYDSLCLFYALERKGKDERRGRVRRSGRCIGVRNIILMGGRERDGEEMG